jgi:transposase
MLSGSGCAPAPAAEAADGAPDQGPPGGGQRSLVDRPNRRSLARPARALRFLEDRGQPFPPLAGDRGQGPGARRAPVGRRRGRGVRLGGPLRGWDDDPSAPARRRGKGGEPETEALGRSRGGFSTKLHVRAESQGKPVAFVATPGQRHEATAFADLIAGGAGKRAGRRRPKARPKRVVGDTGYSSRAIRPGPRKRGIQVTIPRKVNERHRGQFDRATYRRRNRVERLFNWLKQFRRVATRYDKRAANYLAMVTIAAIRLWL